MKSLTSFTINVAKGSKRKVGKSKNKVSRLCKGIVVKEDGEYQVRINILDDPNNPSFITIPFTFDSYEVKIENLYLKEIILIMVNIFVMYVINIKLKYFLEVKNNIFLFITML